MNEWEPTGFWAGIGAAIASLVGGAVYMRTKLSRDSAEIAGNRAEVDMLDRLQAENRALRDDLTAVYEERNKLIVTLAELSGRMTAMTEKVSHLEQTASALREEVARLSKALSDRRV